MTTLNLVKRKLFKWNVSLHDDRGSVTVMPVEAYWDPTKIHSSEVAEAGMAIANAAAGSKKYVALGAELVDG